MSTQRPVSDDVFSRMVALRRDLHAHPELSFEERRTAERIEAALDGLGLPHRRLAGTGVVVDLPGEASGPVIALRADTDALPIQEETGLPFASRNTGVMHACGHDGHTSMLMGAAEMLRDGPRPPLPLRLLWQPAEEAGTGATSMIEAGVLDQVALIFGGHLDRLFPGGTLVITAGCVNASTDEIDIDLLGRGGHGARPHEGRDALVAGAALVTALQTVVAREVSPSDPAVVNVGVLKAGTARNVIAHHCRIELTLRAQRPEVRATLLRAVERLAAGVGAGHGVEVRLHRGPGTPPLVNTEEMAALAWEAGQAAVGPERLDVMRISNMGGEDFASYLEHVPGCYIRFGGAPRGKDSHPAHSGRFDFDEDGMRAGAAWYYEIAHRAGAWVRERG